MGRAASFIFVFISLLSISHLAFAWCDNCGANGCCRCPTGQAQCLGSFSSCEEACGLVGPTGTGGSSNVWSGAQGAFLQGFMNGLRNSQTQRPLTPYQIQQMQIQQQQQQQEEIEAQKAEQERQEKIQTYLQAQQRAKQEKAAKLDNEAESGLSLLGATSASTGMTDQQLLGQSSNANDTNTTKGYQKGFDHAINCISRSAGSSCSAGTAQQTISCVHDYNAGYDLGSKKVQALISDAYQAGETAGRTGQVNNGAADSRASGGCRTEWIESYNRGYFAGKHSN